MKFPYGLSDFATLIQEGYFYQDRTDRLPRLEETGSRPVVGQRFAFARPCILARVVVNCHDRRLSELEPTLRA